MKKTFIFGLATITVAIFAVVALMSPTRRTAGSLFAMNVEALARETETAPVDTALVDIADTFELEASVVAGHPKSSAGKLDDFYLKPKAIHGGENINVSGTWNSGSGFGVSVGVTVRTENIWCCIYTPGKPCDFSVQDFRCDYVFD